MSTNFANLSLDNRCSMSSKFGKSTATVKYIWSLVLTIVLMYWNAEPVLGCNLLIVEANI